MSEINEKNQPFLNISAVSHHSSVCTCVKRIEYNNELYYPFTGHIKIRKLGTIKTTSSEQHYKKHRKEKKNTA